MLQYTLQLRPHATRAFGAAELAQVVQNYRIDRRLLREDKYKGAVAEPAKSSSSAPTPRSIRQRSAPDDDVAPGAISCGASPSFLAATVHEGLPCLIDQPMDDVLHARFSALLRESTCGKHNALRKNMLLRRMFGFQIFRYAWYRIASSWKAW